MHSRFLYLDDYDKKCKIIECKKRAEVFPQRHVYLEHFLNSFSKGETPFLPSFLLSFPSSHLYPSQSPHTHPLRT
jgi:hypothetical protein